MPAFGSQSSPLASKRMNPSSGPARQRLSRWRIIRRAVGRQGSATKGAKMSRQKLLQLVFAVILYMLFSIGCRSGAPTFVSEAPTATPTQMMPTATLTPLPDLPLDVTVTKDLVYAKGIQPEEQREWKLDEYAPTELGHWPVVLFLPGGGQIKEGYATLSQAISEQGAIVFVIDCPDMPLSYAILDNSRGYREMAETVACAIRFARARVSD